MAVQRCLYCGGDAAAPDHLTYCGGRPGTRRPTRAHAFSVIGAVSAVIAEAVPDFGGETYEPARDHDRLHAQLSRVLAVMRDGQWHTLRDIGRRAEAPEASVSARLRDLRKPKFGGHRVERRHVDRGLFEYRMVS